MAKSDCGKRHDNKNLIFVLCGPSGVGKTSLKLSILERHPDIRLCPSVTTRPESKTPHDIKEYHYISKEEYERLYDGDELVAKKIRQFGFYYGIKPAEIIDILDSGYDVLLETTLWGIDQLKGRFNNVVSIFIAPPSIEELKRRLKSRERESDEDIVLRVELAEQVLSNFRRDMVDYCVINEDLSATIDIVNSIVSREKIELDSKHW